MIKRILSAAAALTMTFAVGMPAMAAPAADISAKPNAPFVLEQNSDGTGSLVAEAAGSAGTAISKIRERLTIPAGHRVVFIEGSNSTAHDSAILATGMKCRVVNGAQEPVFDADVIVRGDVTGTGKMTLTQLVRMSSAVSGAKPLDGLFLRAGDWNGNGKIELSDLVREAQAMDKPKPTLSHGTDLASMQSDALIAANMLREKACLPALSGASGLNQAAQVRATEMAAWKRAQTMRPDDSHHSTVLDAEGDIASYAVAFSARPEEAIEYLLNTIWGRGGYMGSQVTDPAYSHFGFGIAKDTDGRWYVCQIFSTSPVVHSVDEPILPDADAPVASTIPEHPDPDYTTNPVPDEVHKMIDGAISVLGRPYEYGGNGPDTFDCSGFVNYALKAGGSDVPRMNSAGYSEVEQWQTITNKDDLRTGDLVFFISGSGSSINHMGIYIGNGNFLHAASSAGGVGWRNMDSGSYASGFQFGKRVFEMPQAEASPTPAP